MVAGVAVLLQIETGVETVSVNVLDTPDALAVRIAVPADDVMEVDAEKLAVEAPPATVTDAGTLTTLLLDVRETLMGELLVPESVTVHAEVPPAVTDDGLQLRDESAGALAAGGESVSGKVTVAPPAEAVITPV